MWRKLNIATKIGKLLVMTNGKFCIFVLRFLTFVFNRNSFSRMGSYQKRMEERDKRKEKKGYQRSYLLRRLSCSKTLLRWTNSDYAEIRISFSSSLFILDWMINWIGLTIWPILIFIDKILKIIRKNIKFLNLLNLRICYLLFMYLYKIY